MSPRRRALDVLKALESGPHSVASLHQRLWGDKQSLYTLLANLLHERAITRLPGRRHDLRSGPEAPPVTFYCLPGDRHVKAASEEEEAELHPVRLLDVPRRDAISPTLAKIRAKKPKGIPAGPTYCRGFAGWGGWRI
jgi:hypothetical protein